MVKDKKTKLWFRAKLYGWGWTPVTWQGWLVTLGYAIVIADQITSTVNYDKTGSGSVSDTMIYFGLNFILSTVLLLVICYMKGERAGWRWGGKK
jgi:hypothetical protein